LYWRGANRIGHGNRAKRQGARIGHRQGLLVQFDFPLSGQHGVLHHAELLEIGELPLTSPNEKPTRVER